MEVSAGASYRRLDVVPREDGWFAWACRNEGRTAAEGIRPTMFKAKQAAWDEARGMEWVKVCPKCAATITDVRLPGQPELCGECAEVA